MKEEPQEGCLKLLQVPGNDKSIKYDVVNNNDVTIRGPIHGREAGTTLQIV